MHPDVRLDDHLCFAIYAAQRAITSAYAEVLDPLGLTYPQYLVLVALRDADGVPVRDLGDRLRLDSGTLTPLLQRLDRASLVRRHRDPSDERRVLVHLTEEGRARVDEALSAVSGRLCASSLDLSRVPALRDAMWELVRAVDRSR